MNIDQAKNIIIGILGVAAVLIYLYGIIQAIRLSFKQLPAGYPVPLSNIVQSVATLLATNLGAILGFNAAAATSTSMAASLYPWNFANFMTGRISVENHPLATIQMISVFLYLASLMAAGISWALLNFSEEKEKVVPLIPMLSKSLIGVLLGALTVALGLSS